jgi:hypothetical protein
MKIKVLTQILCAGGALLLSRAAHADGVQNGDFSAGLADWTFTPAAQGSFFGVGTDEVYFGAVDDPSVFPGSYDEISQDITTNAGELYDISFSMYANENSYLYADFGSNNFYSYVNGSNYAWIQYTVDNVAATGGTTDLAFFGNNQPSFIYLTDISVTAPGNYAVPDNGSTLMLLGLALVGLAALARKQVLA